MSATNNDLTPLIEAALAECAHGDKCDRLPCQVDALGRRALAELLRRFDTQQATLAFYKNASETNERLLAERDKALLHMAAVELQIDKQKEEIDSLNARLDNQMRKKARAQEERDALRGQAVKAVDWGSATGRRYLSVAGFAVAMEGDACREADLGGGTWDKDKFIKVIQKYRATVDPEEEVEDSEC